MHPYLFYSSTVSSSPCSFTYQIKFLFLCRQQSWGKIKAWVLKQRFVVRVSRLVSTSSGAYNDVAVITLYEGPYISFETCGLDMTFEVGENTADYLNKYFEQGGKAVIMVGAKRKAAHGGEHHACMHYFLQP